MKKPERDAFRASMESMTVDQLYELQLKVGQEMQAINRQAVRWKSKMDMLKHRRNDLLDQGHLGISDHAVVRYLERRKGMDIQSIRKEIVALGSKRKYLENTDGHYDVGDGMTMVIPQGNIVATILTPFDEQSA